VVEDEDLCGWGVLLWLAREFAEERLGVALFGFGATDTARIAGLDRK